MKNSFSLFLTVLCLLGFNLANSQTIVSTTPENKNVVLEEFTGIYCTYCPDGHKIAQQIKDANPDDVILVNIHTGGYAAPSGSDPDFRTAWGSALASQSGLTGYPAGTINRRVFSGGATAMGRSSWDGAANTVMAESSVVNVAGTCTLNVSTGEMTILVEVYYTGNSSASTNKLNVAILESNVKGPQTGGTNFNPSNFDSEGNYLHQHMLRDFVTGQWGELISTTTSGSFFTQTYSYTVPSDYIGVIPKYDEISVAAYVAEGNQVILSGADISVVVESNTSLDAKALKINDPTSQECANPITPTVTIQNLGNTNLTSVDVVYDINGGTSNTFTWNGDLALLESEEVTLPSMGYTKTSPNVLNVSLTGPNGGTDEFTSNDDMTLSFEGKAAEKLITFSLTTDGYASETSWDVKNSAGTVIYSGAGYSANNTTFTYDFDFSESDCYKFNIYDSYGDGTGSYSLTDANGLLFSGGSFGSIETKAFEVEILCLVQISSATTGSTCGNSDGTATATATGGTGPYTYIWTTPNFNDAATATGLPAGPYSVNLIDGLGCSYNQTFLVSDANGPSLSTIPGQNSCDGGATGQVFLTVSGGTAPINYAWSNGATTEDLSGLFNGEYTVTVTDGAGCTTFAQESVTSPPVIQVAVTISSEEVGGDGAIDLTVSGGTPAYAYAWSTGATTEDISSLTAGMYTITVSDGFGCEKIFTYEVSSKVGITPETEAVIGLNIYPNPFSSATTVEIDLAKQETVNVLVYNLLGEMVYATGSRAYAAGKSDIYLDGSRLNDGVYFVDVRIGATSNVRKIVHNR